MIIINSKYDELEENNNRYCDFWETEDYEEVLIKNVMGDGGTVIAFAPAYRVTDKDLIAVEGEHCYYNERTG